MSVTGKIGSIVIPSSFIVNNPECYPLVLLSRTFVDADDEWEYIVNIYCVEGKHFPVHEEDGTLLLEDFNTASFRYDGKSTHTIQEAWLNSLFNYKYWRCRTLPASSSTPALAKTAASGPLLLMTFGAAGDYRISFEPANGGKTTVQLFDMLGKLIFAKTIDEIRKPVSFTISGSDVPRTPFLAKVRDNNGTTVRRELPVR